MVAIVRRTDNTALTGMLFNADGQLVSSGAYSTAYDEDGRPCLPFATLPDGSYTLVTMGESRCFSDIGTLSALQNAGLQDGTDYTMSAVTIRSGHTDSLFIANVPTFDESRFLYTGAETRFSANKANITVGQYVTLSTQLDFKEGITPANTRLLFTLPEGCQMVSGSMMVGQALAPYSEQDGTNDDPTQLVRFCVVPTQSGVLQPSASVLFNSSNGELSQPVGTVSICVSDLTLNVPATTGRTLVPVSGMAVPMSDVTVYDGDVPIGKTTALGNGYWKAQCVLNKCYNLSDHTIHAAVTTPEGIEMQSETQTITYNRSGLTPIVTMTLQSTDYEHKAIVIDVDFRTMTPSSKHYDMRGMGRVHCTFKVNFIDDNEGTLTYHTAVTDRFSLGPTHHQPPRGPLQRPAKVLVC